MTEPASKRQRLEGESSPKAFVASPHQSAHSSGLEFVAPLPAAVDHRVGSASAKQTESSAAVVGYTPIYAEDSVDLLSLSIAQRIVPHLIQWVQMRHRAQAPKEGAEESTPASGTGLGEIELEVRLGIIKDTRSDRRIALAIDSPAIVTAAHRFEASIRKDHFENLNQSLGKKNEKFKEVKHQTLDRIHESGVRKSYLDPPPANGVAPILLSSMKKNKLVSVDIHVPKAAYDIRVGLASEVPVQSAPASADAPEDRVLTTRSKKRSTWKPLRVSGSTAPFRIESTEVRQVVTASDAPANAAAQRGGQQNPPPRPQPAGETAQFEVEVEADLEPLVAAAVKVYEAKLQAEQAEQSKQQESKAGESTNGATSTAAPPAPQTHQSRMNDPFRQYLESQAASLLQTLLADAARINRDLGRGI